MKLKEVCKKLKIALIEDCALCGFNAQSSLDNVGDIVIYSIWKFHPISDGAILKINKVLPFNKISFKKSRYFNMIKRRIKIQMKSFLFHINMSPSKFKNYSNSSDCKKNWENFKPQDQEIYYISNKAKKVFLAEDLDFCSKQRMINFRVLLKFCSEKKITPLYTLINNSSVPYCFPIIVEDALMLQNAMRLDGIETEISVNNPIENKNFSSEKNNDFMNIFELGKKVLSIPIHQNIDCGRLEFIQSSLNKNIHLASFGKLK